VETSEERPGIEFPNNEESENSRRLNGQKVLSLDTIANSSVRQAATGASDWLYRDLSEFLYRWADIFNREFFDGRLPQPVISFEKTRINVLGHFSFGRNDQGLKFNINLNKKRLGRSEADLCETLVHEQIHLLQSVTGTSGKGRYHNKEFVQKAASIGLHVKLGRRCHIGSPSDPIVALLLKHGVSFEPRVASANTLQPRQEKQRLRRWSCWCKSVWCGGSLNATCLLCEQLFQLDPTKGG
jgi:hypothetical protein